MENRVIIVYITAGTLEEAKRISRELVEKKLAACVNIVGGVTSIYRWRGRIEESGEYLLIVKTVKEKYSELEDSVRHLHSYEVPEIIAVPVEAGYERYIKWVVEETDPTREN